MAVRGRIARRWPTPGGAALRSALLPGWGQWVTGARALGVGLSLVSLLLLAGVSLVALAIVAPVLPLLSIGLPPAVAVFAALTGNALAPVAQGLAVGSWRTLWLSALALNFVLGLLRAWAALHAAVRGRRTWQRRAPGFDRGVARLSGSDANTVRVGSLVGAPIHPAGWGTLAALRNSVGATLAALLVVAPHATLFAAGGVVRPYLSRVLVSSTAVKPLTVSSGPSAPAEPPDAGRPVWDGTSRLNVLLLGADRRPQEASTQPFGNSDTILLVSVDPGARGAAMISVPRDLWLTIPGVGPEKINAAYREGGPHLAIRVVSDLLGQPVHRWASVDIYSFDNIIDAVGGVIVDVEHPIRDDEFPNEDYSIRRIFLAAGLQWLDGERALWYARSRHGSTDFDRANRQQRLLLGLRTRLRDRATLGRLPALFDALSGAVQTDISPREALALARIAAATDLTGGVRSLVLTPPTYGTEINRPELYAILPNLPRIRSAVAEYLAGGTVSPLAAAATTSTSTGVTAATLPVAPLQTIPLLPALAGGQGGGGPDLDAGSGEFVSDEDGG